MVSPHRPVIKGQACSNDNDALTQNIPETARGVATSRSHLRADMGTRPADIVHPGWVMFWRISLSPGDFWLRSATYSCLPPRDTCGASAMRQAPATGPGHPGALDPSSLPSSSSNSGGERDKQMPVMQSDSVTEEFPGCSGWGPREEGTSPRWGGGTKDSLGTVTGCVLKDRALSGETALQAHLTCPGSDEGFSVAGAKVGEVPSHEGVRGARQGAGGQCTGPAPLLRLASRRLAGSCVRGGRTLQMVTKIQGRSRTLRPGPGSEDDPKKQPSVSLQAKRRQKRPGM